MFLNYVFILIFCVHITTIASVNKTIISNPETQNLQNSTSAPLASPAFQVDQKKKKPNENDTKVLSRGIANTSNVHNMNNGVKIVTEGSGVSKINLNDNASIVVSSKVNAGKVLASTTTTVPPTIVGNSTKMITHLNSSMENNSTIIKTTSVPLNMTSKVLNSSTIKTTASTKTTITTTTTKTPKQKKPITTYASSEIPGIQSVNADSSSNSNKFPSATKSSSTKLSVEDLETPHVQPSQELDSGLYRNHRDYIIPIVSIIFAVPILMGMVIVAYRRFRDFWSTRHYRRMDFLVDGMYND